MMFLLIVTIVSMIVAVIMSVIAWRIAGEERRRSEARVQSLAAEIHGEDLDLRTSNGHVSAAESMFATTQPAATGSRLAAVLATGAVVFGCALTVILLLSAGSRPSRPRSVEKPAAPPAAGAGTETLVRHETSAAIPLELVALGHDRAADTLTVRGVVRNPSTAGIERLTAVVFVFNRDGGFVASGRAAVEASSLGPGGESTFVVTIPDSASVGRYRVSFRVEDRVVPHVDRREQTLAKS